MALNHKRHLTMSRKELNQVPVLSQLKAGQIRQKEAAKKLRLSIRQVQRKLARYRQYGARGLIHRARGKPGNHCLSSQLKAQALSLVKKHYPDFGPTFAAEKLAEEHRLKIHHETLRLLMVEKGLWTIHGGPITAHIWRERKDCFGEMIQLDGSPHDWFEGRGPKCTLLAFIDDATSSLMWLQFVEEEATVSMMEATQAYLLAYGRPLSFYADRGKCFKVNIHNEEEDKFTQFQRALSELDIELIHARSPQAKGRVERLFGTLQDRLVKELRLAGIRDIAQANAFLRDVYLEKHNQKFAVAPKKEANLHRCSKGYDFRRIFCLKEERKVKNDFTVQYKKQWFQLQPKQPTTVSPGTIVTVEESLQREITLSLRKCVLKHTAITKEQRERERLAQLKPITEEMIKPRVPWIPPANHPWRMKQKATFLNC